MAAAGMPARRGGDMESLRRSSHIHGGNAAYVEGLFESYLANPRQVPEEWRDYFNGLPPLPAHSAERGDAGRARAGRGWGEKSGDKAIDIPHSGVRQAIIRLGRMRPRAGAVAAGVVNEHERKQVRVIQLISAYRQRGHQKARLDPLGLAERQRVPDLELSFHELSKVDFATRFQTGSLHIGQEEAALGDIVDALERTYCGSIGAEFMHITASEERHWVMRRMESVRSAPAFSAAARRALLGQLTKAEGLEKALGSRYPGAKRFGLEGAESLIPMLSEAIQRCGGYGAKEIVIGMAHRGRLNVLINVLGKKPSLLFDEFEGRAAFDGSGDVKYHQGFSSDVRTPGGRCHLALAFNPSHLEIVAPVVAGSVRARQDRYRWAHAGNGAASGKGNGSGIDAGAAASHGDKADHEQMVVPIAVHGDAAFAGQGVVMETFQMSQTRGYRTGGTLHIVVNNQIGFTTSCREDARSTEYCTDIAKMVQAPIFHVNADDPEACLFAVQLAVDYRNEFRKDAVIDLVCYRRRGHNEADEPAITQPLMCKAIEGHPTAREQYAERLIKEGALSRAEDQGLAADAREALERDRPMAGNLLEDEDGASVDWRPYLGHDWDAPGDTRVALPRLRELARRITQPPESMPLHRQVKKMLRQRRQMAAGEPVDWGMAESLAYAALLDAGYPVRLAGQDSCRGTFAHRHAVLHSQSEDSVWIPLQRIRGGQAPFEIFDTFLSEEAVLAFEYGYASTSPAGLVAWEAQFGDFANGAQVVIDQFIASGERKWGRLCGLTLLLPHGYEGQGPEHSSARLERFLQLGAEHNIQVCAPTTPAQVFHMLRRQAVRPLRRPLVVLSPKSLLRHREASSTMAELAEGAFQPVIGETDDLDPGGVTRVVLCSGKVYYELREARRERGIDYIALARLEQLYPFPEARLQAVLSQWPQLDDAIWCQEEPMNQGAWYSSQHHMRRVLQRCNPDIYLKYAGRPASAAPAAGYLALHQKQQRELVDAALEMDYV